MPSRLFLPLFAPFELPTTSKSKIARVAAGRVLFQRLRRRLEWSYAVRIDQLSLSKGLILDV